MSNIHYIEDMEAWRREFSFFHLCKVRFSETDMFGHMNNTVPFVYFEEASIAYFKHKGFMQNWVHSESDTIPVVADLQCDFLAQLYFDDAIKVYVKVASIGKSSVDLHYMGEKQDGTICFVGRGAMVQYSKKTGRSEPWTEEMLKNLISRSSIQWLSHSLIH